MTTLLLIWYASGWASLAYPALQWGKVTLGDLIFSMLCGPGALLVSYLMWVDRFSKPSRVLWRKR